jgi:hypothetical protein
VKISLIRDALNARVLAFLLLGFCLSGCASSPLLPTPVSANATDGAGLIGEMAVAFLNRFAASSVSPQACLVDFSSSCRGTSEELSDIQSNREHFQILGARLGTPSVVIAAGGASANISIACSFDSRTIKCDTPNCRVGDVGSVAGTCTLTSIRESGRWKLCTSNFSGSVISPTARTFFGADRP